MEIAVAGWCVASKGSRPRRSTCILPTSPHVVVSEPLQTWLEWVAVPAVVPRGEAPAALAGARGGSDRGAGLMTPEVRSRDGMTGDGSTSPSLTPTVKGLRRSVP